MEELEIDEIVDVPDTPDRLARRRYIGRGTGGRDSGDSPLVEKFKSRESRDILFENHVNGGLRAKDKTVSQNGHHRRPIIHPSKSFSNPRTSFGKPNVSSSSEDSLAPQNDRLFRKAAVDDSSSRRAAKPTSGFRNTDKGKSICIDKPSSYEEGVDFLDLTEPNEYVGNSRASCPNGALKNAVDDSQRNGKMPHVSDSFDMFGKSSRRSEKIGETASKGPGSASVRGETIVLSPDSQHKTREHSSPRVTGRRCLVKNGCISPLNIAKAEQSKGSSKNTEQSRSVNGSCNVNGSSNYTASPDDIISEVSAAENDNGRKKGKALLTIQGASKSHYESPCFATRSSHGSDSREANRVNRFRKDASGLQEPGPWRTTHNHSRKQDNSIPDVVEHNSGVVRLGRRENERNRQIVNDHLEFENGVTTQPSSSFGSSHSSGRPRTEKIVAKKPKKQVATSSGSGECSTSMSEDPDVLFLGPSRESMRPRHARIQRPQSRATLNSVIEVDELSPLVRRSAPRRRGCTNVDDDDHSDIRALQVEADEMLARELQEQFYQEVPTVGSGELEDHLAWTMQQENGSSASGAHQTIPQPGNPRARSSQSRPRMRGGIRSRAPASSRMAQIRGRAPRPRNNVLSRARNLDFPVDMDMEMRFNIMEALEAVGVYGDVNLGNPIYQVQRDFNENDYEMLLALDDQNHQHSGASTNVINSLPQSVVQTDNQEACAVCLETPTVGETVRHLPCFHKFHKDCIDPWLTRKTSCPVCKLSIT